MRHFLGILAGAIAAGATAAVLPLFAKPSSGGTGFRGSELKVLPIIVFFIVSFAVANAQKKHTVESSDKQNEQGKTE